MTRRPSFITAGRLTILVGSLLVCAFMFLPFLWAFVLSFKDNTALYTDPLALPRVWDFSLYADTFEKSSMPTLFKNSLVVAILTTLGCLLINFPSAFAIARLHRRHALFGNFFYFLFLIGAAVPVFITIFPIYTIAQGLQPFGLGIDSIFGLIPPYIAGSIRSTPWSWWARCARSPGDRGSGHPGRHLTSTDDGPDHPALDGSGGRYLGDPQLPGGVE